MLKMTRLATSFIALLSISAVLGANSFEPSADVCEIEQQLEVIDDSLCWIARDRNEILLRKSGQVDSEEILNKFLDIKFLEMKESAPTRNQATKEGYSSEDIKNLYNFHSHPQCREFYLYLAELDRLGHLWRSVPLRQSAFDVPSPSPLFSHFLPELAELGVQYAPVIKFCLGMDSQEARQQWNEPLTEERRSLLLALLEQDLEEVVSGINLTDDEARNIVNRAAFSCAEEVREQYPDIVILFEKTL